MAAASPIGRMSAALSPGWCLTLPVWLRRGGRGYWQRTEGQPPHPEAQYPLRKTSIPRVPRR
jgi:hypothetical protein